ncbi:MAG: ankyrin repeat domain-containing protein [Akkermansia sp.]
MSEENKVKDGADAPAEQKTNWALIIGDMLKLMLIVSCIGVVFKIGMSYFERTSPSDDLVSIVSKNQMDAQGVNPSFLAEIAKGEKADANFINLKDDNLTSPLMWVCYANFNNAYETKKTDIQRLYYVKYFLGRDNLELQAKDKNGFNALHWAAWSGLTECCSLLINAGLDMNQPEDNGYTPLMLAALRGNDELVENLLALGADATATNKKGETAKDIAVKHAVAYKSSDAWVYGLIYNQFRENAFERTVALLQGAAPAPVDMAVLVEKTNIPVAEQLKQIERLEKAEAAKP